MDAQEVVKVYCLNCRQNYKDNPGNREWHVAPCTRCDGDGHSTCQHRGPDRAQKWA
jgi:hypothetical protein